MTEYVRTRGGRIIHRGSCSWLAGGGVSGPGKIAPWNWAEGKTLDQIRQEMRSLGLEPRFARCCFDLDGGDQ